MNRQFISLKRGFTFIELLIAITIFSILSLAVFNSLNIGFKVTKVAESQLKISHKANSFLDSLTKELNNAVIFYVSPEDTIGFIGKSNELSFFCAKDVFTKDISDLRQIVKFGYYFQDGRLFRDQKFGEDLTEAFEYTQEIDLPLKILKFYYFTKPVEDEPIEYKDEWPPQDKIELPFGVKVEMLLLDESQKKERIVSKEILLPIKAFNQTQSGT